MFRRIAIISTMLLVGCFLNGLQPDIPMRFERRSQRSFPAVDGAQVKRYWGLDSEHLPDGVTLVGRRGAPTGIAVERDFPNAADAHEIVGELLLGTNQIPGHKDKREAFLAEEVGKRGGNAYVEMPQSSSALHLIVLHLSSASVALAYPAAATLLAEPLPELASYQPTGAPELRQLSAFSPLVIDGKRGTCYAVRAVLDSTAMLNSLARRALELKVASPKVHLSNAKGSKLMLGARVSVRSVAAVVGCPQADGPIPIAFNVGFNSAHPDAGSTLGTGEVQFQVYERGIAAAQLDRDSAQQAAQARRNDDQQRAQFSRQQCLSCNGQLAQCPGGTDPANCQPFRDCLFRLGISVDGCR